jgi:teichuronic acid biosynthesis protein TuaE
MIGYIFAFIILVIWILLLFSRNSHRALCFLIASSTIFYGSFTTVSIDLIIKFLVIFSLFYYYCTKKINLNKIFIIFTFLLLFLVNLVIADFSSQYTISDNFTGFVTLFTGLLLSLCEFNKKEKKEILYTLSILPIISIACGLILSPIGLVNIIGRGGTALAGASLSTNLSFFCVISCGASLLLFSKYHYIKFRYLAYFNYFLTFLTLTRGGILAATIIILCDVFPVIKKLLRTPKGMFIFAITIALLILPMRYVYIEIAERTFSNGELNTSGRIEAWKYIINMSKNVFLGNGYGYLKTSTDTSIKAFTAPHNEYVHFYFEMGIIGSIVMLLILLNIFKISLLENTRQIKKYCIFIIFSFFIYSFFDNTILNFRYWFPFMLLIGTIKKDYIKIKKYKIANNYLLINKNI